MCCDEGSLHDVHVLSSDWVVQTEQVMMMAWDLHWIDLIHWTSALMSNVVDHEHASRVCQFVMVSVVNLQDSMLALLLYFVKEDVQ